MTPGTADCRFVRRIQVDRRVTVWTAAALLCCAGHPLLGDDTPAAACGERGTP
jgi:hypothetical protein